MERVIIQRPVNGRIMCEKCLWADQCPSLKPCDNFALAVGTNFSISEPMILVENIHLPEYTIG